MEKTIIDIIDKKAQRQYNRMTGIKRKAYRAMLYAGVQITLNGYSVRVVPGDGGHGVAHHGPVPADGDIGGTCADVAQHQLEK